MLFSHIANHSTTIPKSFLQSVLSAWGWGGLTLGQNQSGPVRTRQDQAGQGEPSPVSTRTELKKGLGWSCGV